jgi:hypothetical protein
MKVFIPFLMVSLTVIACNKSVSNEEQNNDSVIIDAKTTESPMYQYDFYKVILQSGNIIYKENSLDVNRNIAGINDENYDINFFNKDNNIKTTIVSDKFYKIKVLPVVYNQTRQNHGGGDDVIKTSWWKCFVLQVMGDNNYKLIYIDDFNNDMKIKEYEYKNSYYPDITTIIITPHYFIVHHDEIDGNEYTLIDQHTGEYTIIDTERSGGHKG